MRRLLQLDEAGDNWEVVELEVVDALTEEIDEDDERTLEATEDVLLAWEFAAGEVAL